MAITLLTTDSIGNIKYFNLNVTLHMFQIVHK